MQVLLRRESRKGGVILKNRCRFFFDGKKTRFSKMQMALGGEQAGTCVFFYFFLSFTIPNVNVDFAAQPWSKGRLAFFSIGLGLAFTSSAFLAFGPEKIVG